MPAVTGSAATGQASGAAGLVKSFARQEGIELAPNEIKQLITATAFDVAAAGHRRASACPTRRRPAGTSTSATACPTSGLALRADRRGEDPAAGADHLARVVRAAERQPAGDRGHPGPRCRPSARRATPTGSSGRRASSPPRPTSRRSNVQTRTSADDGLGRRDSDARRRSRARARRDWRPAARPSTRPRPPRARATRTRTSPPSPCASSSRTPPATAPRTARCCSPTATRRCTRASRRTSAPAARRRRACSTSTATTRSTRCSPTRAASCSVLHADGTPLRASTTASRCARACTRTCTSARRPTARSTRRARCCARPRSATSTATTSPRSSTRPASTSTPGRPTARPCAGFPVRLDPALSRPQDRTRNNHIKRGFTASPALGDLNRGRRPRDRRAGARPARLRLGRQRQPAARLPEEAARPEHPRRRDHHHRRARRRHR